MKPLMSSICGLMKQCGRIFKGEALQCSHSSTQFRGSRYNPSKMPLCQIDLLT